MATDTNFSTNGKEIKRQACQVYTRVMGYLRPISMYNVGKKSEFYSRKYFTENKSTDDNTYLLMRKNAEFAKIYG